MNDASGMTVAELVALLRQRRSPLPFEIGAFVALRAVECLVEDPVAIGAEHVLIDGEGIVSVDPPDAPLDAPVVVSASRVLGKLLVASGAEVPRELLELVEAANAESDVLGLEDLCDELEASLVPLNRGAARRVLARFLRDIRREEALPGEHADDAGPDEAGLDDDLDALLDAPPPKSEFEQMLGEASGAISPAAATAQETSANAPGPEEVSFADGGGLAGAAPDATEKTARTAAPVRLAAPEGIDLSGIEEAPERAGAGGAKWIAAAAIALLVACVLGVAWLRPDILARITGDAPPAPEVDTAGEEAAARAEAMREAEDEARARYGDLTLRATPDDAQVFLFVGEGPATVPDLPVGVAHEFLVLPEGGAPGRAVVPPGVTWESGDDGARFELAAQAPEGDVPFERLRVGDRRARELGTPSGARGTVRVLTNPPGAGVYLLVGTGASTRIADVDTREPLTLLVARDGLVPQRVTVASDDWTRDEAGTRHEAEVTLSRR